MKQKTIRFPVVGVSHRNNDGSSRQSIIGTMKRGDVLQLRREPDNPYDPSAVAVDHANGQIGYVSRARARVISEMLDADLMLSAKVAVVVGGHYPGEYIGVRMDVTHTRE